MVISDSEDGVVGGDSCAEVVTGDSEGEVVAGDRVELELVVTTD